MSALTLLQSRTSLNNAELKSAIAKGALWLEKGKSVQRLRRVKKLINTNETLHFYYNEDVLSQAPPEAKLIDDQQSYSVWYKPYGMLSQGSKWSDHCTITRWAQLHLPNERACFLVHRLDRATSGLIIIAHTKNAARAFSKLFEQHELTKSYHAVLAGNIDKLPFEVSVSEPVNDKHAVSHFKQLATNIAQTLSLYEVTIETGRKHQIRQHAKWLGSPIVGDRLYGEDSINQNYPVNLQLCAVRLAFGCPLSGQPKDYRLPKALDLSIQTAEQNAITSNSN
ncbi:RNA pseudouridine synthase [Thalassotalea sp. M1531]|uniref:RNA pseudouridine synthase n=2 Tax=Thalassotalea algicola TaxID=2716224 RepID=A0A7Y0Q7Q5_9GAMM|nr:RNA pseudouridine synthase [Thalassotalea algicola]